eukprot:303223-Chlamydomonas_euryale.AAC.1
MHARPVPRLRLADFCARRCAGGAGSGRLPARHALRAFEPHRGAGGFDGGGGAHGRCGGGGTEGCGSG